MEIMTLSQFLIILGLICEGGSAYFGLRNIPWSIDDWKKKQMKTLPQKIKAWKNEKLWFIGWLVAGLSLQAAALFFEP